MAMKKIEKRQEVIENIGEEMMDAVEQAMDDVSKNDQPFVRATTNTDTISVLGDPQKIAEPTPIRDYEVTFILPKAEFSKDSFEADSIREENDEVFVVKTTATQEKVTPYNRGYLSTTAIAFISNFFVIDEESSTATLKKGKDLSKATLAFFREEDMVEAGKFFVGKMLGIDEELIPYLYDVELVEQVFNLIGDNPTLMNEAYFSAK